MTDSPAAIAAAINQIDDALAREYMICGGWDGAGASEDVGRFSYDQGQAIVSALGTIEQQANSLPETDTIRRAANRWLVIARKHWDKADETAATAMAKPDPAAWAFAVRTIGQACERLRDHAVPGMVELLADVTVAAPAPPAPPSPAPSVERREALAELLEGRSKKEVADVCMLLEVQRNKFAESWTLDEWESFLKGIAARTTISETITYKGLKLLWHDNKLKLTPSKRRKKKPRREGDA